MVTVGSQLLLFVGTVYQPKAIPVCVSKSSPGELGSIAGFIRVRITFHGHFYNIAK